MTTTQEIQSLTEAKREYKHGFTTNIEQDFAPPGLSEDTVRFISAKKGEPQWMLDWRLKAYRHWLTMTEPTWAFVHYPKIDYQATSYFAAPKKKPASLDEVDPEILKTFEKLGIPLNERAKLAGVAVDAVFDSVSVATTFKEKLSELGIIFCSFGEAVREHPDLVQKYMGSVVPYSDNFFATLNSAVFTDGSFVYIPEGVKCPMELSTYFRINAQNTGQFERTLIIADKGASVSYLEGCTAPQRDENQLHAAVVELIALDDAKIKYSTIQNWYPGDETGKGGIYNFVTKRGACRGVRSHISWTQVETGSSITNPASANSLVGIRPTFGLIPSTGVMPGQGYFRDVMGPLAKTVKDAAAMMDVIAGYTPDDPKTIEAIGKLPVDGYVSALDATSLQGARIGVYGPGWNSVVLTPETQALFQRELDVLAAEGATLVADPFLGSGYRELNQSVPSSNTFSYDINQYFGRLGESTINSVAEFNSLSAVPWYDLPLQRTASSEEDPATRADLVPYFERRDAMRALFHEIMDTFDLDALVMPQLAAPVPDLSATTAISRTPGSGVNIMGIPGVVVPGGYYADDTPFATYFVGRMWDEAKLIG
ncbi:MAG: Fe-S cluster assembly protein SufB, partial [Planctomycetes bacterium]|nr:Fe-S cluster assembly protein SufB [Planctomycetota bacterium]